MWIFPILNPVVTFSSFSISNYLCHCCFTTSSIDNNSSSTIDRYHVLKYLLVIIKSYWVLRYIKRSTFTQTAGRKEKGVAVSVIDFWMSEVSGLDPAVVSSQ